jgi:hypothetical protein
VREIVFALEFRGRAGPAPGSSGARQARTTAPSQALTTVLAADGPRSAVAPVTGEDATLESRVERFADGGFVEDGTITYGSAGRVTFVTVGRGYVGPSPIAGLAHGVVMWRVTQGDGIFAGAEGLITSNFTVSPDGLVIDDHFARLYLPGPTGS